MAVTMRPTSGARAPSDSAARVMPAATAAITSSTVEPGLEVEARCPAQLRVLARRRSARSSTSSALTRVSAGGGLEQRDRQVEVREQLRLVAAARRRHETCPGVLDARQRDPRARRPARRRWRDAGRRRGAGAAPPSAAPAAPRPDASADDRRGSGGERPGRGAPGGCAIRARPADPLRRRSPRIPAWHRPHGRARCSRADERLDGGTGRGDRRHRCHPPRVDQRVDGRAARRGDVHGRRRGRRCALPPTRSPRPPPPWTPPAPPSARSPFRSTALATDDRRRTIGDRRSGGGRAGLGRPRFIALRTNARHVLEALGRAAAALGRDDPQAAAAAADEASHRARARPSGVADAARAAALARDDRRPAGDRPRSGHGDAERGPVAADRGPAAPRRRGGRGGRLRPGARAGGERERRPGARHAAASSWPSQARALGDAQAAVATARGGLVALGARHGAPLAP